MKKNLKIEKSILEKLEQIVYEGDVLSFEEQVFYPSDILMLDEVTNTCSMLELSMERSYDITKLNRKEFDYLIDYVEKKCIICNVVKDKKHDKYLKSIEYKPVSTYRGIEGIINTYIFIPPAFKVRSRKKISS